MSSVAAQLNLGWPQLLLAKVILSPQSHLLVYIPGGLSGKLLFGSVGPGALWAAGKTAHEMTEATMEQLSTTVFQDWSPLSASQQKHTAS